MPAVVIDPLSLDGIRVSIVDHRDHAERWSEANGDEFTNPFPRGGSSALEHMLVPSQNRIYGCPNVSDRLVAWVYQHVDTGLCRSYFWVADLDFSEAAEHGEYHGDILAIAAEIVKCYRPTMSTAKSERRGRPRKPARERRTEWIGAAVTHEEKREFKARAVAAGHETDTSYLRECVGFGRDTPDDATRKNRT